MTAATYTPHPFDAVDLEALKVEAAAVNAANGWHDEDRTVLEGCALLHSELSEALEAYRSWGLADKTDEMCKRPGALTHRDDGTHRCKPEGVGSELADVLIRLLDEAHRHDFQLIRSVMARLPNDTSFGTAIGILHASVARFGAMPGSYTAAMLLGELVDAADRFGVDLLTEYHRKIAFNRTRGYKHGGKLL